MPTRIFLSVCCLAGGVAMGQNAAPPAALDKGLQITVRTVDAIHSKQSEVGQNYRCTVDAPVMAASLQVVAKGSDCVLQIVELRSAGNAPGATSSSWYCRKSAWARTSSALTPSRPQ